MEEFSGKPRENRGGQTRKLEELEALQKDSVILAQGDISGD